MIEQAGTCMFQTASEKQVEDNKIYNQRPGRNKNKINTAQPLLRMDYKFEDLFSCQTNSKKNYERCFWYHLECDKKRKFKVLPRNRDNVIDLTRCSPHTKFSVPHVRDQSVCVHRWPKLQFLRNYKSLYGYIYDRS